jgi:DNA-directed RNA polymerase subunit RPC12/RpoP
MEQLYDRLPTGTLDAFEKFRNETYNYTYLCRACARSFDSKTEAKVCKFCQGTIVLLRSVDHTSKGVFRNKPKYRYVCSTCDAEFESVEPISNCHYCRTKWLHVHRWEDLGKTDKFSIKFLGAVKNLVKKREKHRTRIHRVLSESNGNTQGKVTNVKSWHTSSFSLSKRFSFKRRSKEELPTY